ncbi:MAG: LysM domain-containing protein [Defluviitaleaceae bacterium]|nr:LysM domain-containing protein [Defluviitaleaceae bacterium]
MSKKIFPLDRTPENAPEKDMANFQAEKSDAYYSEEMSRAAVGRLFDVDEGEEDGPPPIKSAFVKGFDRPAERDKNPTKKRERVSGDRFKPPENQHIEDEASAVREEQTQDRHRRRETATTRLLHGGAGDDYDTPPRGTRGRRNPDPKPAVRVNVPTERQVRESHQGNHDEIPPSSEDLDNFRSRYNAGELFSPPRNNNRPVRPGQSRDVRTNRVRVSERDMDTISPLRMIITAASIFILVLVSVLTFQLISARGRYSDAQDYIETLRLRVTNAETTNELVISNLQDELNDANDLIEQLQMGIDPNQPVLPPDGTHRPGEDVPDAPATSTNASLPTTHTIVSGDRIERIAQRYFGNSYISTQDHIVATNISRHPTLSRNNIHVGWELDIVPMS